jgi:hypothetical protein
VKEEIERDHIQATNVIIEDWDGNLTISAIYCPILHSVKKETDLWLEVISIRNTNIGVPH